MVTLRWILFCPVTLLVCCIGLITNTVSMVVWRRLQTKGPPRNQTICSFFIILSILDFFVLVFSIVDDVLPQIAPELLENHLYGMLYIYACHPLHFYFLFTSIFLVTALSMERLKFILDPLSRLTTSKKWSNGLLISVFVFSALVNIPSFFEFELARVDNTTVILQPVHYKKNTQFRDIVFFSHCIFGLALPWLTTLVCNITLVSKSFNRLRISKHTTVNSETVHILKTTIAITFSTLLLLSFQCISRCFKMFELSEADSQWLVIQKAADLGHVAIPLNSTINFFMFCLPGSYFRKELSSMCCRSSARLEIVKSDAKEIASICSENKI